MVSGYANGLPLRYRNVAVEFTLRLFDPEHMLTWKTHLPFTCRSHCLACPYVA
jgi:hypothetical protein